MIAIRMPSMKVMKKISVGNKNTRGNSMNVTIWTVMANATDIPTTDPIKPDVKIKANAS